MIESFTLRRFFARGFDLFLLFNVVLIFQIAFSIQFSKDVSMLIGIPIGFFGAVLEGILVTIFAATPGKALLGLSVVNSDNSKLTLLKSIKRSFKVYGYGYALAIPFLAPITQFTTYRRLKTKGITIWDEGEGHNVIKTKSSFLKTSLFIILILLLVMFFFNLAPTYYTIR